MLDDIIGAKEMFLSYAEIDTREKEPTEVDSRYISEDVPTPIATGLIEIAGAALGRSLCTEGRTSKALGIGNLKKDFAGWQIKH